MSIYLIVMILLHYSSNSIPGSDRGLLAESRFLLEKEGLDFLLSVFSPLWQCLLNRPEWKVQTLLQPFPISDLQSKSFLCTGRRVDIHNKNPNISLLQKGYPHSLLIHGDFVHCPFLFCTYVFHRKRTFIFLRISMIS